MIFIWNYVLLFFNMCYEVMLGGQLIEIVDFFIKKDLYMYVICLLIF